MHIRFSVLLLLLALAQSYIWTRKKIDDSAGPQEILKPRRRPGPGSKYVKKTAFAYLENSFVSANVEVFLNGDWNNGISITLTADECAQPVDLSTIVGPKVGVNIECSLYTFYGTPVRTCADAIQRTAGSDTVTLKDLFIVPAGRFFMLPAKKVGDVLHLYHIDTAENATVELEVVSIEPRIFKVRHFVSSAELAQLQKGVDTGASAPNLVGEATSNKAVLVIDAKYPPEFTESLKTRLFQILGMQPYQAALAESVQTKRYKLGGAQQLVTDYLSPALYGDPPHKLPTTTKNTTINTSNEATAASIATSNATTSGTNTTNTHTNTNANANTSTNTNTNTVVEDEFFYEGHDYDSSTSGHNRYASLLLYTKAPKLGGEVVFSKLPSEYDRDSGISKEEHAEEMMASHTGLKTGLFVKRLLDQGFNINNIDETMAARDRKVKAQFYLKKHNATSLIPQKSWERELVGVCRRQRAVTVKQGDALLYYNQNPFGKEDKQVLHGSCPVLKGEKWTNTFHVWNGPRYGYWARNSITGEYVQKVHLRSDEVVYPTVRSGPGSGKGSAGRPAGGGSRGTTTSSSASKAGATAAGSTTTTVTPVPVNPALPAEVNVSFTCVDIREAELYWEDQLWEVLVPGRMIRVNSFVGHQWHIVVGNVRVASWTVSLDPKVNQDFIVSYKALGIPPPMDNEL